MGTRGRRARVLRTVGAATALAALLSGCAPAEPEQAILPDGVEVGLIQLRADVAAREAQVRVVNGSAEPLEIGAVEVVDDRFADAAARTDPERVTTVRPGATVDIRVALPAMACDTVDGEPRVRLELAASGAVVETGADDLLGIIAPLHERECRAERLADAAAVGFRSFHPSPAGQPAQLDLAVSPTGRAEAVLVELRPTNLLSFAGADPADPVLPIRMDIAKDTGETVLSVPIVPARCDPHAVQEDKRGTVFTLEIGLDGEPGTIEIAADEDMRADILAWVSQWCA